MKYKVIHVIDKLSVAGSGVHGVTKIVEKWIRNFDKEKFEFVVVSLREEEEAGKIFTNSNIPIEFFSRSRCDLRTITDLIKIIKEEKADLLHLHGYSATDFGRVVSLITGIPSIVHEHAILLNQPIYQTIADALLAPVTKKGIAVSQGVATFMNKYRGIPKKKIEVVFNGIEVDSFKYPSSSEIKVERDRLGIPDDSKVICTTGRLDPIKGLPLLIKAAKIVVNHDPKIRFLIVGEGPEKKQLIEQTKQLNIDKNIIFTGFHNEVEKCLGMSDLFVMSSLSEGMPISILEAMIMELPIVAFSANGVNEIIESGKNGVLVPLRDYAALADNIINLLENKKLAEELSGTAKKNIKNFAISNSTNRISEIYLNLIKEKNE